jgi:SseB protein N-terminal domain
VTDTTPLDAAHAAADADPEHEGARLAFYARLADGELFVLLAREATGGSPIEPRIFPLEDGPVVLAFDTEARLAGFSGGVAPYAAMPGRVLAAQLKGRGIGLGVNLGVAPSSMLLPPEALDWLAMALDTDPMQVEARPILFHAPTGLPEALVKALDAALARAGGLATGALLAGVTYEGGRRGHMLAYLDAASGAEAALAKAASEALVFSGVEAGEMDVAFLASGDAAAVSMARVALRFDLTASDVAAPAPLKAGPGMDPARPPKLR